MNTLGLGLVILSLSIWLGLLAFRGQFWRSEPQLEQDEAASIDHETTSYPAVCAVIPARNEADMLPISLRSLLKQHYPGSFTLILVDDHSTDGTAAVAQQVAQEFGQSHPLQILSAAPLPPGWTGKLWALEQGTQKAQTVTPDYILLTDADVEHHPNNLQRLVTKAQQQHLDLVSVMVRLRCDSFWENLLIPAFVFFFAKLYPFRWVNHPDKGTAAAAGGCILLRQTALTRIGGMQAVRQALIDDCALAAVVKHSGGSGQLAGAKAAQPDPASRYGKIWLGLSDLTRSLRPYPSLQTIWDMVARTAFTQLNYSPLLLLGTLLGMTLIYLVPPVELLVGALTSNWLITAISLLTYLLMTLAYLPTVQFYRCSPGFSLCLPAIAFLYTLMTLDSALRHWQGQGGAWKGRVYTDPKL